MNLDFVLLADAAVADAAGKVTIRGGGVTHVAAPKLPFSLPSIAIVARFFIERADLSVEQSLTLRVRDPEGAELLAVRGPVTPPVAGWPVREAHAGEDATLVVVATLSGIEFEREGQHTFETLLNDDLLVTRNVVVFLEQNEQEKRLGSS